jgi:hypothetical protein
MNSLSVIISDYKDMVLVTQKVIDNVASVTVTLANQDDIGIWHPVSPGSDYKGIMLHVKDQTGDTTKVVLSNLEIMGKYGSLSNTLAEMFSWCYRPSNLSFSFMVNRHMYGNGSSYNIHFQTYSNGFEVNNIHLENPNKNIWETRHRTDPNDDDFIIDGSLKFMRPEKKEEKKEDDFKPTDVNAIPKFISIRLGSIPKRILMKYTEYNFDIDKYILNIEKLMDKEGYVISAGGAFNKLSAMEMIRKGYELYHDSSRKLSKFYNGKANVNNHQGSVWVYDYKYRELDFPCD